MWSIKCYKSNYKIMMFVIGNYLTKLKFWATDMLLTGYFKRSSRSSSFDEMNIVILITGKTSLSQVWLTVEETITRPVPGIFIQAQVSTCFERFFHQTIFAIDAIGEVKHAYSKYARRVAGRLPTHTLQENPFIPTLFDLARFLRDLWLRDLKMERQARKSIWRWNTRPATNNFHTVR